MSAENKQHHDTWVGGGISITADNEVVKRCSIRAVQKNDERSSCEGSGIDMWVVKRSSIGAYTCISKRSSITGSSKARESNFVEQKRKMCVHAQGSKNHGKFWRRRSCPMHTNQGLKRQRITMRGVLGPSEDRRKRKCWMQTKTAIVWKMMQGGRKARQGLTLQARWGAPWFSTARHPMMLLQQAPARDRDQEAVHTRNFNLLGHICCERLHKTEIDGMETPKDAHAKSSTYEDTSAASACTQHKSTGSKCQRAGSDHRTGKKF